MWFCKSFNYSEYINFYKEEEEGSWDFVFVENLVRVNLCILKYCFIGIFFVKFLKKREMYVCDSDFVIFLNL